VKANKRISSGALFLDKIHRATAARRVVVARTELIDRV